MFTSTRTTKRSTTIEKHAKWNDDRKALVFENKWTNASEEPVNALEGYVYKLTNGKDFYTLSEIEAKFGMTKDALAVKLTPVISDNHKNFIKAGADATIDMLYDNEYQMYEYINREAEVEFVAENVAFLDHSFKAYYKVTGVDVVEDTFTIEEEGDLYWLSQNQRYVFDEKKAARVIFADGLELDMAGYCDAKYAIAPYKAISNNVYKAIAVEGNGAVVKNLAVKGEESVGLFGYVIGDIADLTVLNSTFTGNHWVGGIAGRICGSIKNCHVDGATIVATPNKVGDDYNNGDKAGAIVGYSAPNSANGASESIENCSARNSKISAFRDLGGIVGHANTGSYIANNKIVSSYVVADQTAEYYEAKAANAAEIVGRVAADAVLENNEFGGGINAANYLDVRVIYRANNADNLNANSDKIAILPAGDYVFNAEVTALALQLNEGESTLNANTLNLGNTNNYGVIVSGAAASLVINDANVNSLGGGLAATNGAYVEFNGDALYLNSASTSGRYAIYAEGENSKVVVNGGDFSWNTAKNNKRAYVYCAAGATVEINGGTFAKPSTRAGYTAGILGEGNIVIKGGTFAFNPSAWVAEGYQAVYDDATKTWTVQ